MPRSPPTAPDRAAARLATADRTCIPTAWAKAGAGDADGAVKAIDALNDQSGVEGLHAYHKALLLDYLGRNAEAEASYKQAIDLIGTGPRAADAYGHFLIRQGRIDDAKALYQRIKAENPGQPVADIALADIAANRKPAPFDSFAGQEGAAEGLFGIAASLSDQRNADLAILLSQRDAVSKAGPRSRAGTAGGPLHDRLENYDAAISYYSRHSEGLAVYFRWPKCSPRSTTAASAMRKAASQK